MSAARLLLILPILFLVLAFETHAANSEQSVLLTPEERSYLARKKEITFCVDPDWMPFEAIRSGQLDGMTTDFSSLFSERLGVPFHLVPTSSWSESKDWAKAGKCDILPMIPFSQNLVKDLAFTDPYLTYSVGIISSDDLPFISGLEDLSNHPVGIVEGYSTWEYVERNHPESKFVPVEGIEDGLLKVSSGQITAFLIAVPVAVHNIKILGLSNLKVAGHIQIKKELRIGVSRQDPNLPPIIKKLVSSLTKDDVNGVYHRWITLRVDSQFDYGLVWKIVGGFLIVIAFIVAWNRKLSLLNKRITERDEQLDKAQSIAHLGTWRWNLSDNSEVWSNEQFRIFGYEPGEVEASYELFLNAVHPDDREKTLTAVDKALNEGAPYSIEFRIIRKNGETRFVSAQGEVEVNTNGKPESMIGTVLDITDRVELESNLLQAAKMATLGEMATGIAHELNQPLNVIRMSSRNIKRKIEKESLENEYLQEKLSRIDAQIDRATKITDHMRVFGRKSNEEASEFTPTDVILTALDLVGEQLRLNSIEVETDFDPTIAQVSGHDILLEQVLLNLLINSRDAIVSTAPIEKRISIRTRPDIANKEYYIEVEDTGGGVPSNVIEHIFDPFYTTKEVNQGTGLGLSISYGIVSDWGGEISVSNTERGACFRVKLPLSMTTLASAV